MTGSNISIDGGVLRSERRAIADIRAHVLLDPGYDVGATRLGPGHDRGRDRHRRGLTGIGETDLNAWIARACIEAPGTHTMDRGLRAALIGRGIRCDVETIWQELYVGSA